MSPMTVSPMAIFAIIAAVAVVATFFNGVNSMAHGGAADQRDSHWLMFQRVGWQALAVAFLLFAVLESQP